MIDAGAQVLTTNGECEIHGFGPPTVTQNQIASMIGGRVREKVLTTSEANMHTYLVIAKQGRYRCTSANN
jgi:hypothetical protein